ncbi:hypothetical protein GGR27_003373 [Lewinella antarctica]|uniref:RloB domain-containing protein n=2 Tax=Neolewinella antarctica TaxID=442734 RepID=A0ABX0XEX2_9BACT|nr:hypothetical protein [Neolewinella antarctica]
MDTRINLQIISPDGGGNTSPTEMIAKVEQLIRPGPNGETPKYQLLEGNEIWFVIDTDDWGDDIDKLRAYTIERDDMNVAQSNVCFEVWLCFHFSPERQNFNGMHTAQGWKDHLNEVVKPGGFDSQRHPLMIKSAIDAAAENYQEEDDRPLLASTQVFRLGN